MSPDATFLGFVVTQTIGVGIAVLGVFSLASILLTVKEARTDGNILMLVFGAAACGAVALYVVMLMVSL